MSNTEYSQELTARAALAPDDVALPEFIRVPRHLLAGLFDLAVNSMDFGSGFWDQDDALIARAVAVLLGVNPLEATPRELARHIPHEFEVGQSSWAGCRWCHCKRDDPNAPGHQAVVAAQLPPDAASPVSDRPTVGISEADGGD